MLYWGLQVTSSFSICGCVLKGCFERGIFWRAKSRLKGIEALIHVSFWRVLEILALQLKARFKSKTSIQEYKNEILNLCMKFIWYMFPVQCEELRINHLTLLLVVTTPYACWFLWHAYYTGDFKWRLHFQFGVTFWRVVFERGILWRAKSHVWRALKTSI
jgi:hypothetical protein